MKLILADMPLKQFLSLFPSQEPIRVIELGDTGHPSSGYVGTSLVHGVESACQLLAHEYDFAGLVYFEAALRMLTVKYQHERYEVQGETKALAKLVRRIEERNAQADWSPKCTILAKHN